MNMLHDISGKYTFKEIDKQTGFGNEYILKIKKTEQNKYVFEFNMSTFGEFGKMGETWKGTGIARGDHVALIIEEHINWIEEQDHEQRIESNEKVKNALPIELFPFNDDVVIFHKKIDKIITLKKTNSAKNSKSGQ